MKFSILLPTRDRLPYLKQAVETVRRQDYDDWEIIISDNQSRDDVASYVRSLDDSRIRYSRTDRLLPVTENWNRTLRDSRGDYVIMLGDDDGLRKGYLSASKTLIERFGPPDSIYTGVYIYAYPNVLPDAPNGALRSDVNQLLRAPAPYWLAQKVAAQLVRGAFNFRMLYAFNMQYSLISRTFIDSLREKGDFFQSPYPDFYATNALFFRARRILIYPTQAAIIGITPKSYGFFHFNYREHEGADFLQNEADASTRSRLRHVLLPGSRNNTCWLFAMQTLKDNFGDELPWDVNYSRYRFLQVGHTYKNHYVDRRVTSEEVRHLREELSALERLFYGAALGLPSWVMGMLPDAVRRGALHLVRSAVGQHRGEGTEYTGARFVSLLDVFEGLPPLVV